MESLWVYSGVRRGILAAVWPSHYSLHGLFLSACAQLPNCSDSNVADTVKRLQAKIWYSEFLKSASLGNDAVFSDGVRDLFDKAYTPDAAELSFVRVESRDEQIAKLTCRAELSTKTDIAAHEREFRAGIKRISEKDPKNVVVPLVGMMGLMGLRATEVRSISYTIQRVEDGDIYVETRIGR
jgi:hypothetical protein